MEVTAPAIAHAAAEADALRLRIDGLSVGFRKHKTALVAVDNVSFDVAPGEFVCLLGPSGCGKSTVLNAIAGLVAPSGGSIHLGAIEAGLAGRRLGYMFQKDTLLPWASALDNVLLPMQAAGRPDVPRAQQLLELVGLTGFEGHYPRELSGGMRKRVQLARLLAQQPDVLLLDEPFGALDALTKLKMQEEFLTLWDRDPKPTLFVTHDLSEAIILADRIIVMTPRPGRIQQTFRVPFDRPRNITGVMREPAYNELFQQLWDCVHGGKQ